MPVSFNEFLRLLSHSGLMTAREVQDFLNGLPSAHRPVDAVDLVRELYRQGKLTKYQSQSLYHGRSRGLVLGNYVILDRLGQGGMGQVFKAQHRRMQRIVALKVLPPELMKSPAIVQRFEREVQAAARLSHPNIVTAYDADEATGIHFLVMECVDGENLATLVRRGPLPPQKALACISQAARGPRICPQTGHHSSRHQAVEFAARQEGRHQNPRHGPGAGRGHDQRRIGRVG